MTDQIKFPEGGKEEAPKRELPNFPEDASKKMEASFQKLVEAVNAYSNEITQLAVELGVPEFIQSPGTAHRKALDHIDVGINHFGHRSLTQELPTMWVMREMQQTEGKKDES